MIRRKHEVDQDLGTLIENQLVLPEIPDTKKKSRWFSDSDDTLLQKSGESIPLDDKKSSKGEVEPEILRETEK